MFKLKIKDFLGLYFSVLSFIIILIGVYFVMIDTFPQYKEIAGIPVNVLITIFASSLGGLFTLLGVDKTFEKQSKIEFVKQFPMKVFYLDELIKELHGLESKLKITNSPFLILDQNKLASLFNIATEIDGYIYFETRKAHLDFSQVIIEMFSDPDKKIFTKNDLGENKLIEGKENENQLRVKILQSIVQQLLEKCSSYRNSFTEYYNKNVDQDIYNLIKKFR